MGPEQVGPQDDGYVAWRHLVGILVLCQLGQKFDQIPGDRETEVHGGGWIEDRLTQTAVSSAAWHISILWPVECVPEEKGNYQKNKKKTDTATDDSIQRYSAKAATLLIQCTKFRGIQ